MRSENFKPAALNTCTELCCRGEFWFDLNIYEADMGAPNNYAAFDSNGSYSTTGTFTATAVAAPEPSQVISMLSLAGMGGAGLLLKLRRRK